MQENKMQLLPVQQVVEENKITNVDELLQYVEKQCGAHFAKYARKMVVQNVAKKIFPDVVPALAALAEMLILLEQSETPTTTFCQIADELPKMGYNEHQQRALFGYLCDFIDPNHTTFEDWQHQQYVHDLVCAYLVVPDTCGEDMKAWKQKLFDQLKTLPETLSRLDAVQRAEYGIKLLPYLLTKENHVTITDGLKNSFL